jgi:hypothetical protein
MIVKEYTPAPTTDRFQKAGDEAERQMAHYLKRVFGDNPNVHVVNHLRLEHEGEVAQIDHLIFHRAGFIIVESKSVTGSVRINEREEWARQWNGRWSGMPSPVLQARRQADMLRALLQAHKVDLRNKILFGLKQGGFKEFIIDVVVAISDQGVIESRGDLPDVKKADQVPDHVKALIQAHARAASLLSSETRKGEMGFNLSPEEFVRVSAFLRNRHQEKGAAAMQPSGPAVEAPAAPLGSGAGVMPSVPPAGPEARTPGASPSYQCSKCKSADLEIRFGHTYYFHCRACSGNTPIKLTCPPCGSAARTRKRGSQFFRECSACGSSELYFTNPQVTA